MDIRLKVDPFDFTKRAKTAQDAVSASAADREDERLKQASRDFEGIFLGMMLKEMRQTLTGDPILNGGHGEEIFSSMRDQQLVTDIARGTNQLGLGEMIYRQLTRKTATGSEGE